MTPGVFKNRYMDKRKFFAKYKKEPFEALTDDVAIEMDEVLYNDELKKALSQALLTLSPKEERIIRMRYGIGMNTTHTLEEIGQVFSRTRESIRRYEARGLRKLRHPKRTEMLRDFLEAA